MLGRLPHPRIKGKAFEIANLLEKSSPPAQITEFRIYELIMRSLAEVPAHGANAG